MIDETTYTQYRAMLDKAEAWIDTQRGKNGWASWRPEEAPDYVNAITNDMRSAVEVYELHRDKPAKFTAYTGGSNGVLGPNVTTWTGDVIGKMLPGFKAWRDRHGNKRYSIRVRAAWGGEYIGQTAGPGMCVNLRRVKQ